MPETAPPPIRQGETTLPFDPTERPDATISFIGRIRSPWTEQAQCPRNIAGARRSGQGARIELAPGYEAGLAGLSVGQPVMLLYWMDRAHRNLIVQMPGHADGPRGTFALRSPNRPNPVAMSCVTITAIRQQDGIVEIDAIDCLDGTPLVDLKPWKETIDTPDSA
ncbi:tRNA (N6-threonylcarbamoyladenosine(37)-N6)-methyltransferase TrmO [Tropicimonas sp.]|uniref:tRNA (N6-threonylcarbamoyladenosine(37)-N6)-methyltransferase TrmO n=1 Tax=Tropicimonas sp. TaxID=2067044 RepID=UPI003A8BEFA9